jgi:catecholate siderophore receptor
MIPISIIVQHLTTADRISNRMNKPISRRQPHSLRQPVASLASGIAPLALSISTALMSSLAVAQSETEQEKESMELETVYVEAKASERNPYAEPGAPYKARTSGDMRHMKPLAEIPQTINVLTQAQIQESGKTDLREILSAQPGITLGTGENGNAFGDRYIIRGHEARSDVFVDSLRDPGMTLRESFATEQIEVTKGPSSTFAGKGSSGGAINSITKFATHDFDFTRTQAGAGTDDYHRFTLDSNRVLTDELAVRVNLLEAYEGVPDREPADRVRQGIALSGLYQANDKLQWIADYYYLNAEDMPDLGTYIVPLGQPNEGKPIEDIATYAQEEDFLKSEVEVFTLRMNYDHSDTLRIQNNMRYGTTNNGYVATGARGNTRHNADPVAPREATIALSTHQGWQNVEYFVDQVNVYLEREMLDMTHNFMFSAEYSELNVINGVYQITNNGTSNCRLGTGAGTNGYCILGKGGKELDNLDDLMGRDINRGTWDVDYNLDTLAFSIMDTIDITDRWSIFAGARVDSIDYDTETQNTNTKINTLYAYEDDLLSYQMGTTFKITEAGMVYFNYSSANEINGGESDVGSNCGYGGLCGDPEQVVASDAENTENYEIGTKWNLFHEKLLLNAALFRITKDNVMESVGNAYSSLGTLNTGENEVDGYEIGLTGNITDELSVQFGMTRMESEVLDSFNEAIIGRRLSNFADNSTFMQLRYQVTPALAMGATATYESEKYVGQPDTAASFNSTYDRYNYEVPDYTVYDFFASYDFSKKTSLMLNVGNVTNEAYYLAAYQSGAFTYIGDGRSIKLTLSHEF